MADNKTIHFNKADYDQLMRTVGQDQSDLETLFLEPKGGMMLDGTLGSFVKPGSPDWAPISLIHQNAQDFGSSVSEKFGQLDDDWTDFLSSLRDVSDVFSTCSDLATMSAEDFRNEYPDFGGGTWGSGSGGPGSGSSGANS